MKFTYVPTHEVINECCAKFDLNIELYLIRLKDLNIFPNQ